MIAIGRLRFLNLLNCAENWHKSCKNRDRGGFSGSLATEFWDLATS